MILQSHLYLPIIRKISQNIRVHTVAVLGMHYEPLKFLTDRFECVTAFETNEFIVDNVKKKLFNSGYPGHNLDVVQYDHIDDLFPSFQDLTLQYDLVVVTGRYEDRAEFSNLCFDNHSSYVMLPDFHNSFLIKESILRTRQYSDRTFSSTSEANLVKLFYLNPIDQFTLEEFV